MDVAVAVAERHSVRAFRSDPVPMETVGALLTRAARAPSGGNLQPWEVTVVHGAARDAAARAGLEAAMRAGGLPPVDEHYPVYPVRLGHPWRSRRSESGEAMYAALGIPKHDKAARLQWLARNFDFFGAPVGIFIALDRSMGHSQWAHAGMFAQTFALLAVEAGLGTCFQEAWATVRDSMHGHLRLPDSKVLWCGIALGYPDTTAAVNSFRTDRVQLEEFVRFLDAPVAEGTT